MLTHSLSMYDYVALAVDDVDDAKNEGKIQVKEDGNVRRSSSRRSEMTAHHRCITRITLQSFLSFAR